MLGKVRSDSYDRLHRARNAYAPLAGGVKETEDQNVDLAFAIWFLSIEIILMRLMYNLITEVNGGKSSIPRCEVGKVEFCSVHRLSPEPFSLLDGSRLA